MDVHGWAWFARAEVASCSVTLDGDVVATAVLGPPPPDVAARRPETAPSRRCGWHAALDLTGYAGREVVIGALATSDRGVAQHLASARVIVTAPPRRVGGPISKPGGIDHPLLRTPVTGQVPVSGWVLADEADLDRVELLVNGRTVGPARLFARPRPDVAAQWPEPLAALAGFEHLIQIEGCVGDTVAVDAELVTADGRRRPLVGTDLVVGSPPPPPAGETSSTIRARLDEGGTSGRTPARALRLVVFTHNLLLGGAQLYLQELLRDLIKNHDVPCLVVAGGDGPLRDELEMLGAGVHVTDFPFPDSPNYRGRCVELGGLARSFGANVAVVNTLIAGIGADVARALEIPSVWAVHESYTLEDYWAINSRNGSSAALASLTRDALAGASVVLFEADATRAVYQDAVGGSHLTTLHYGVELEAIETYTRTVDARQVRRAAGWDDDDVVLLCLGTFEPRKAQAVLATAFARVAEEFPAARLALIGDIDDPYSRALRELVGELDHHDRIRIGPMDPDPYPWYAAADAFVLASDLESMPRVIIEAMAFGLPVVAADVWGIPELVHEGENGVLFPPRDVGALTDALRSVLRLTVAERQTLGESGARLVRRRHDLADYRQVFARLVQALAERPEAPLTGLLGSPPSR